ncbi:hypothetical protein V6N12_033869 [Hibiscus sabdariffa]|uniref:Uncharacterized protein n=1 Tax=Hibiscus sabdariffa TaxID=183260 RepID=A0ABR2AL02_9ROSI
MRKRGSKMGLERERAVCSNLSLKLMRDEISSYIMHPLIEVEVFNFDWEILGEPHAFNLPCLVTWGVVKLNVDDAVNPVLRWFQQGVYFGMNTDNG